MVDAQGQRDEHRRARPDGICSCFDKDLVKVSCSYTRTGSNEGDGLGRDLREDNKLSSCTKLSCNLAGRRLITGVGETSMPYETELLRGNKQEE
jgi:hypothetical protein